MTDALPDTIRCMLLPLQDKLLLIPNTTVIEVVHFPHTTTSGDIPNYWVGHFNWRAQQLAIIDIDALLDQRSTTTSEKASHVCILKGIHNPEALNAYALPCYAPPQLISIDLETLNSLEQASTDWLYAQIKIGSKVALIPDLDALESLISNVAVAQ